MLARIGLIAVVELVLVSSSQAATRITLTRDMFSLAPGSTGDPGKLADEQALVGDPLAGQASDPTSTWLPTDGMHPNAAYLDLGANHALTDIAFYDRNGTGDFRIYDDVTGALLVQDDLRAFEVWKLAPLAVTTRRLRIENSTGFARVPELVLYGAPVTVAADPEFKVTAHTADGHRSIACQPADCDLIIAPVSGQTIVSSLAGSSPVGPGARVCVAASQTPYRGRIFLSDLRGTADRPIEIVNCGGQVVFDGARTPLLAQQSVHFKVTGDGDPRHVYGFRFIGSLGEAVKVRVLSRDFELAWLAFENTDGVILRTKSEVKGNDVVTGQPFVQTGTHVHHMYSNVTTNYEAMYIGNTGCEPPGGPETFPDAPLRDVLVHDNILIDSGADALQVGCATGDVQIRNNYIRKAGYRPFNNDTRQRHGIQVGPSSTAKIVANWVEDTQSECIHAVSGLPEGLAVYNNVFKSCPQAVYLNARVRHASSFVFANNTVIEPTGYAIRSSGHHKTSATQFVFYNNLFVGVAESRALIFDGETTPQPLTALSHLAAEGQRYVADASQPGFVNADGGDYRLRPDAAVRDAGSDTAFLDVVTDLRGVPRDEQYDIGAYEYAP